MNVILSKAGIRRIYEYIVDKIVGYPKLVKFISVNEFRLNINNKNKKLKKQNKVIKISYENDFLDLDFYWIGWSWGWAISTLRDPNGEIKVRIAKVKKNNEFPETEMFDWDELNPREKANLKESGGHVNFKNIREVEAVFSKLREKFESLKN